MHLFTHAEFPVVLDNTAVDLLLRAVTSPYISFHVRYGAVLPFPQMQKHISFNVGKGQNMLVVFDI